MFFGLVARTATLGNFCNLHKSKMAAIDSGWDTILQLVNRSIWRLEVNIAVKGQVKYNFKPKK